MPKYYVTCGELKYIGEHKNQHDAAIEALLQKAGPEVKVLPQEIRVSEVGHEPHKDDFIFNTTTFFFYPAKLFRIGMRPSGGRRVSDT